MYVLGLRRWDEFFLLFLLSKSWGEGAPQVFSCFVVLSEDFLGEPFESKKSAARLWRSFVAHDARHLDLAGTSLASRVCGQARWGGSQNGAWGMGF